MVRLKLRDNQMGMDSVPSPILELRYRPSILPQNLPVGLGGAVRVAAGGDWCRPAVGSQGSAAANVQILGYVIDVVPFFDSCRLSVAPLRYGAGAVVKGKINQSLA